MIGMRDDDDSSSDEGSSPPGDVDDDKSEVDVDESLSASVSVDDGVGVPEESVVSVGVVGVGVGVGVVGVGVGVGVTSQTDSLLHGSVNGVITHDCPPFVSGTVTVCVRERVPSPQLALQSVHAEKVPTQSVAQSLHASVNGDATQSCPPCFAF
jgi:hypothetical protein